MQHQQQNEQSPSQRVVITGMGWVTPLGESIDAVWKRLLAGESAVRAISRFDASTFPTTFAAQIRDYDFRKFVRDPELHAHARLNTQFALGAAAQAWNEARLGSFEGLNRDRVGLYLGAGEGPPDFDRATLVNLAGWEAGGDHVDASAWYKAALETLQDAAEFEQDPHMPIMHLAQEYGVCGPGYNCLTACAASTQAIGEARVLLQQGDVDVMIAGGAHTMLHPLGLTGFNRLTALSTRNDSPETASRPFDVSRDGFVLGEGSGVVILETLEHARKRGAPILAEIAGFGSSADAFRITDMEPTGRGAQFAMREALRDAGIDPEGVDAEGRPIVHYISAHGTSTSENDSVETKAIKAVFGPEFAKQIPVSSIKSMMGHLIAAAGVVELITCVLAIRDGMLPPTINHHTPDPECDLDYVPNQAREARVDVALSNSFGFGGQNDTLIVRRLQD